MNRFVNLVYDHIVGYIFLCRICRRPVFAKPPRASWLFEALVTEDDELKKYLAGLGIELPSELQTEGNPQPTREKFSEVAKFHRTADFERDDE